MQMGIYCAYCDIFIFLLRYVLFVEGQNLQGLQFMLRNVNKIIKLKAIKTTFDTV